MNNHQTDRQQSQAEESEDDDRPVGRILSRREVLALLGGGSALLIGSAHVLAAETVYLPLIANNSATATPIPSSPALRRQSRPRPPLRQR